MTGTCRLARLQHATLEIACARTVAAPDVRVQGTAGAVVWVQGMDTPSGLKTNTLNETLTPAVPETKKPASPELGSDFPRARSGSKSIESLGLPPLPMKNGKASSSSN
ncbi:uncharacterized protein DSM5745_00309 [Aspergillus mulundensis]|uniref:Uncharacterized protein n=1 Tax=Aspergillus mulundensis TaxID=1810919 RepID=A0A3D8T350_9EURO|nr:hypothetical protein DSM5745_00309 [Aspergillus mulundensis]RDW92987.1 hypothetical protein DSM5745_00309 [Aspergillus mulundensis]